MEVRPGRKKRLSTNVRHRLESLREGFYTADEFMDRIVASSFDTQEEADVLRDERMEFLKALQRQSEKELKGALIRFDRLEKNATNGRSLFELIQKIAEHTLKRKGVLVKFPDWLLTSLERETMGITPPADQNESSSSWYDEDEPAARSPRRNNTPQQEVQEAVEAPVFDDKLKVSSPRRRSAPARDELESMNNEPRRSAPRRESIPRRSTPTRDELESRFNEPRQSVPRRESMPRRSTPTREESRFNEARRSSPRRDEYNEARRRSPPRDEARRSSPPRDEYNEPPRDNEARRSSPPRRNESIEQKTRQPKRPDINMETLENVFTQARSEFNNDAVAAVAAGRQSRTPSPRSPRQAAGGREKKSKKSRELTPKSVGVWDQSPQRSPRIEAGARTPLELTQAQRVALHFMTPGDASRQTLIEFVDLVKPLSSAGLDRSLVFDPEGPVSDIRNYAYELWLNQTDEQLFTLAEDISGGMGSIHPAIETELNDAVGRYTRQLEDIKRNGELVMENIKTQAQKLKGKSKENFLKCADDVQQVLDPKIKKQVQCTQIDPSDKPDKKVGPSKWLALNTPNLDEDKAKFLMDMSPRQMEEFADYLVSQTAIGTCRMSTYLEAIANTLETKFQTAKQGRDVPMTFTTNDLETLRFLEWVMRRPTGPHTKDSTAKWLFKYPYLQGPHKGVFKTENQQRGVPFDLASLYISFKPRNADDQTLSKLFKATEKENMHVLEMATLGDRF
jgi:hypothetical protein